MKREQIKNQIEELIEQLKNCSELDDIDKLTRKIILLKRQL